MRSTRMLAAVAVVGATVLGTMGLGASQAPPANAAPWDGVCDGWEFCLFWGGNGTGAAADYYGNLRVDDFGDTRYPGNRQGAGQRVKNNAASAMGTGGCTVRVYYNENQTGPYDQIYEDGVVRNLVNTWNDNASMDLWACSGG